MRLIVPITTVRSVGPGCLSSRFISNFFLFQVWRKAAIFPQDKSLLSITVEQRKKERVMSVSKLGQNSPRVGLAKCPIYMLFPPLGHFCHTSASDKRNLRRNFLTLCPLISRIAAVPFSIQMFLFCFCFWWASTCDQSVIKVEIQVNLRCQWKLFESH